MEATSSLRTSLQRECAGSLISIKPDTGSRPSWSSESMEPERRVSCNGCTTICFPSGGSNRSTSTILESSSTTSPTRCYGALAGRISPSSSGSSPVLIFRTLTKETSFNEASRSISRRRAVSKHQQETVVSLQEAIAKVGVTTDEEIAHCLARIVTDATRKPYFEYRDFIPRHSGSVVAEGEEAPYFGALVNTIIRGSGAKGVAFLIDEFEEVGLQKRLTKRAAHDYLATLKRLINLSRNRESEFWIVLSLTPDAYETTRELEPALAERLSGQDHEVRILPLTHDAALDLIRSRLKTARSSDSDHVGSLFPFPDDLQFRPTTLNQPPKAGQGLLFCNRRSGSRHPTSIHRELPP